MCCLVFNLFCLISKPEKNILSLDHLCCCQPIVQLFNMMAFKLCLQNAVEEVFEIKPLKKSVNKQVLILLSNDA